MNVPTTLAKELAIETGIPGRGEPSRQASISAMRRAYCTASHNIGTVTRPTAQTETQKLTGSATRTSNRMA